ncbi:caspase family protein [Rhodoferax sp. GW822-FHT02A01]|uniref:caspase family protein n=1 Tax=Rhodoferax sp. GW822-FHT02A01 TaxID=3141537 RepID=UPI00315DA4F4
MTLLRNRLALACFSFALGGSAAAGAAEQGVLGLTRATELRADKLADAAVVQNLSVAATVRLLSAEGGWAWVSVVEPGNKAVASGWIRASALNWKTQASAVSTVASGREVAGNSAMTLGVRMLPPRSNRHALIIGISRYADPGIPELPGVKFDRQSATQMAQSMQVPAENIRYLQDDQATGDGIRKALQELNDRVQEGDRVFIHYSGHGTRYLDPAAGGCVEALLAYDGGTRGQISNHEMASLLSGITNKTDKLFVMYDACHSGGVAQAQSTLRTRGISVPGDEGNLRGKFVSTNEECGRPVNVKTRNLIVEATAKGMLPQDIIHLSASRDNEISFDDEAKGGLATQYMRDCMLRDAKDLDNSGSISIDEIRQCAQEKINQRMATSTVFKPHNLVLNGNTEFVPAWFSQPALAPVLAAPSQATAPAATTAAQPAPVVVAAPPLTGEQALKLMYAQRDAKHAVQASVGQSRLKIGKDALDLSVQSDKSGYVYLALAGSDNQSVYLLFPNDLDQNNRIEAGQTLQLPRPNWRVKAGGPEGMDNLLVVVADAPRDISALAASKAGPFMVSLNDAKGRAQLGALLTSAKANAACDGAIRRSNSALCSDAYGAALLAIEEKQ